MKNRRLLKLSKKTQAEITYSVSAVATYYSNLVTVFVPFRPFEKMLDGYEADKKIQNYKIGKAKEEDIERSLRRTKKSIKGYALCNRFELFATFTFAEDRDDTKKSKSKMQNWVKNEQKRKGKFDYIHVPEFHKDKKAIHFHSLIKGYPGELKPAINPKTGKQIIRAGRRYFSFPSFKSGFTNVKEIDTNPFSQERVASYLAKYITKDMPILFGQNRYWASSGLKTPDIEYNPDDWYKKIEPLNEVSNEFGRLIYFIKRDVPERSSDG